MNKEVEDIFSDSYSDPDKKLKLIYERLMKEVVKNLTFLDKRRQSIRI
jgi:hypothetical protein